MVAPAGRHRGRRPVVSGPDIALAAIMGFVFTAVIVVIGLVIAYDTYALSTRGHLAWGDVIDEYAEYKTTFIDVRFTTNAGEQIQGSTDSYVDDPPVEVGDRIRIIYDPQDPETFQDARYGFDYVLPIVLWAGAVLVGGWTFVAAVRD